MKEVCIRILKEMTAFRPNVELLLALKLMAQNDWLQPHSASSFQHSPFLPVQENKAIPEGGESEHAVSLLCVTLW